MLEDQLGVSIEEIDDEFEDVDDLPEHVPKKPMEQSQFEIVNQSTVIKAQPVEDDFEIIKNSVTTTTDFYSK